MYTHAAAWAHVSARVVPLHPSAHLQCSRGLSPHSQLVTAPDGELGTDSAAPIPTPLPPPHSLTRRSTTGPTPQVSGTGGAPRAVRSPVTFSPAHTQRHPHPLLFCVLPARWPRCDRSTPPPSLPPPPPPPLLSRGAQWPSPSRLLRRRGETPLPRQPLAGD
jgi:hypothetical protein